MIFIVKDFRTIVFIFIVISTTFRPICPPAFSMCLLSKFLRRSLLIFIVKGFWTIVFQNWDLSIEYSLLSYTRLLFFFYGEGFYLQKWIQSMYQDGQNYQVA